MNRRERRAAASNSRTASFSPNNPVTLYEAGLAHLRAGQFLDAQRCCQQALKADPGHADSLHLMGLLMLQAREFDLAVEWISRAIQRDPKPQYLFILGTALRQGGRLEESLQAFDKAIQLKPDAVELWRHRGHVLAELNRWDQALDSFQRLLKLNPADQEAAYKSGSLLFNLERWDDALAHAELSHRLNPSHALTLQLRALAKSRLGRMEEALVDIERAHALDPSDADTCNHAGSLLHRLGRSEAAQPWYAKALSLRPNYVAALINKGFSLLQLQRLDEALACYDQVKTIDPDNAEAEWNASLIHLMKGDFEAGWAGREARWRSSMRPGSYPPLAQPMWLGRESVEGKTILIVEDEGHGDTIQHVRYMPMLAERGARVVLVVGDPLQPLLSGLSGVSQCLPKSTSSLPAFDMHCPICSLPLAFGTRLDTIPVATSYLPVPSENRLRAWEQRLQDELAARGAAGGRFRIGLVWSGNAAHVNDHNRSLPLRTLLPLLDLDATFVNLQKDPRAQDAVVLRERSDIIDLTADLTDFAETAALVSCLDLVITVDTSVAHLSAALGRPTWILLPYAPDYRWLLDRDDSPWYPTARLFRQSLLREYSEVVNRVRMELAAIPAVFGRH